MGVRVTVQMIVQAGDGSSIVDVSRSSNVLNPDPRQPTADPDLGKERLAQMVDEIKEEANGQLDDWKNAIERVMGP